MADFVASLVDMGFERAQAERAVRVTGNIGVEPALEWITANLDTADDDSAAGKGNAESSAEQMEVDAQQSNSETGEGRPADVPRSYKCEDCGKVLKDETEMEFHAAKTQHVNFSESTEEKKPLTAEEKAEQLKRIEQKLKEKRIEREANEKLESLDREKMRIKAGKELLEAKKLMEQRQIQEIVEARRREKEEEKRAKERVRAQIAADQAARKAKQAAQMGVAAPAAATSPSPSPSRHPLHSSSSSEKKDYKETKIQLRLPNGKAMVHSFGAQEPLAAVRLYVELNRDDGVTGPFNLMSTFPRKVYESDDYDQPLSSLGLVPSAVLMVTRLPSFE